MTVCRMAVISGSIGGGGGGGGGGETERTDGEERWWPLWVCCGWAR